MADFVPKRSIYWKDLGPRDTVELRGKIGKRSYVAITQDNHEAVVFWHGNEAERAQKKLDNMIAGSRRHTGYGNYKVTDARRALTDLLAFVTSGRRYKSQNPYTIPEVNAGFLALGLDRYGDKPVATVASRPRSSPMTRALKSLLEFVTSGQRYERRNPYTVPAVRLAMKALGQKL